MSTPSQNLHSKVLPPMFPAGQAADLTAAAPLPEDDWKQEVNERLAAHRTKRAKTAGLQASLPLDVEEPPVRSRARVAARVAARYATVPSYSEVLAQQAEAAVSGQVEIPAGEEADFDSGSVMGELALVTDGAEGRFDAETKDPDAGSGHGNELESRQVAVGAQPPATIAYRTEAPDAADRGFVDPKDRNDLTAELRDATMAANPGSVRDLDASGSTAGEWIPGNVIEFPRVLVAARKARPRLAEGPLREEPTLDSDPVHSQLRIFEVEQQSISTTAQVDPVATEWSSLRLEARPPHAGFSETGLPDASLPHARLPRNHHGNRRNSSAHAPRAHAALQTASLSARVMAGLVDTVLVALAFLAFVTVFVACTTHPPGGKPALIAAVCTLVALFLLYQYLFFTYSEGTPGMRYARIALCTFDDENPTRRQMRSRIGALMLSACPLALGFAWAWFDEERLGWHDRMSKTYQRSYR